MRCEHSSLFPIEWWIPVSKSEGNTLRFLISIHQSTKVLDLEVVDLSNVVNVSNCLVHLYGVISGLVLIQILHLYA